MNQKEEDIKRIKQGNISLIIDTYEDLFSDFDPRPTEERGLSIDFLDECRRAVRDKEYNKMGTELRILVPKSKRNLVEESLIKKRLKEHFTKHFNEKSKEIRKERVGGILLVFAGILLMFLSYLAYSKILFKNEILRNISIVITEPAGWFLFWIGGERFVYKAREIIPEQEFYKRMQKAKVIFQSY